MNCKRVGMVGVVWCGRVMSPRVRHAILGLGHPGRLCDVVSLWPAGTWLTINSSNLQPHHQSQPYRRAPKSHVAHNSTNTANTQHHVRPSSTTCAGSVVDSKQQRDFFVLPRKKPLESYPPGKWPCPHALGFVLSQRFRSGNFA